jgi:uncharacterized protein (DUF488 family)
MSNINREKKSSLSCFTIGHSDYSIDCFIQLLKKHDINNLVDIRSTPYSQHSSQFNRELLAADLRANNILYVYMGNQLGGRHTNPDLLFQDGKVDYTKVKQTTNFIDGIEKIIQEIKKDCKIALMCSEKDPFDCHRFVLVACELENKGVTVKHILENGDIVLNSELEEKLLHKYKEEYGQFYLFVQAKTKEQALEEALRKRNLDIAFSTSREKK